MTIDYSIFYKTLYRRPDELAGLPPWDILVSAYNDTDRVKAVFEVLRARNKQWIVHTEYGYSVAPPPPEGGGVYAPVEQLSEDDFVLGFMKSIATWTGVSICVDISGFMRPHLMFLLRALAARGVSAIDVIYSEPMQYTQGEETQFAYGDVHEVRPVAGFAGVHDLGLTPDDDLLVIGEGYEHELSCYVANAKSNTRKLRMVGFPPLQADFYQENRINAHRAAEAVSAINDNRPLFAPASDPFATASVLQETIDSYRGKGFRNAYLCPISTRAQALGFALYYIYEGVGKEVSIIYPFVSRYRPDAAAGIARIWKYRVEFPRT